MKSPQFGSLKVRVLTGRTVYRLIHATGKYHDEDVRDVGTFSSKQLAQETAKLLKTRPDFRDRSGKFRIYETVIDRLEYSEKGWAKKI